jgi:TonB family protein
MKPSMLLVLPATSLAITLTSAMAQGGEAPARPLLVNMLECKPTYPAESLRALEEGKTVARIHVAASGALRGVSVIRSSGSARLDQAVIDAMSRCRFTPARHGDVAVDGSFTIEYVWRIEPPATAGGSCAIVYPVQSLKAEEQGTTTLEFHVGEDGKARDARVARSSGYARLDAASIEALGRCVFRQPVTSAAPSAGAAVPHRVDFVWKIENGVPSLPVVPLGPVTLDPYRPAL